MDSRHIVSAAGVLTAGIIIGASILGNHLAESRMADRVVTVKGLVERDVVADMATWTLSLSAAGNDLGATQAQMEASIGTIKKFLIDKGFKDDEISIAPWRVIDRLAREYGENRPGQLRYLIQGNVGIRTNNVALVQSVSRATNELVRAGVTLASEGGCNGPTFLFTKLNDIKPEMLAEATKNARKAAAQFAADSDSKVGQIKRAYQGTFSITERDAAAAADEGGGYSNCSFDPNKKVRVVTTVDYYLE